MVLSLTNTMREGEHMFDSCRHEDLKGYLFILKYFIFIYLFCCAGSYLWHLFFFLVVACKLLGTACGIWFPDQGPNSGPLHWEREVLASRQPGKSLKCYLKLCR